MRKTVKDSTFGEKGVIHLLPLLVVGVFVLGFVVLSSYSGKNLDEKYTRLSVLSESDNDSSGSGSSGTSGEVDNSGSGSSDSEDDRDDSDSSGSGSSGTSEDRDEDEDSNEVDSSGPGSGEEERVETEVRYPSGIRVRTREEEGRRRVDIYEGGRKLRIETRDGRTFVTVENEDEEEVEEVELAEDRGVEVEATGGARIEIRSRNRRILLKQGLVEAQTDFPVSVNQDTGELTITTPAGERIVTVLPQQAIENMLASNVIDRILTSLPQATVSPSPEATGEAELARTQDIELAEEDGEIVYLVEGAREERLLGLFDVLVPKTAVVSAEDGNLLEVRQPLLSRVLDILSF